MPRLPLNLFALVTFALTAGTWWQTHSWWKSALTASGCALLAFSKKIWSQLEPEWTKRIATWLDERATTLIAGYSSRYAKHLYYKHRTFDVKGFSIQGKFALDLESIYVDLSMDVAMPSDVPQDPLTHVPTDSPNIYGDIFSWLQFQRNQHDNFAIVGPPGSGKTTLLKHLALALAARRSSLKLTPILLFLRDHAAAIGQNPDITLAQLVESTLKEPPPPIGWFDRRLRRGRCLIMFDGLDEIGDKDIRQKVVSWVEKTVTTHWDNWFLLSSRPNGYRENPVSTFTVLRILPFEKAQTDQFIENWYLANEIASHQKDDTGVRMEARQGASDLRERLMKTPALQDLAVNPLLLTLIATVHRYRSKLPGRRVELYAEICDVFLGKRQQARGLELDLTSTQSIRVLRVLAYAMMSREVREISHADASEIIAPILPLVSPHLSPPAFLNMVEDASGLLNQRENGIYAFAHLTFQEYLASVHIKEEKLGDELASRITNIWWHETARLYSAQADASPIIKKCLEAERPDILSLMLAVDCEAEAFQLSSDLRHRLREMTGDAIEHDDPVWRSQAAELMLARRKRDMINLDDNNYIDSSPLSCAEYQLFVDETLKIEEFHQPDHWKEARFPRGDGRTPITGIKTSDAKGFCVWLTTRDDSKWSYLLPETGDIKKLGIDLGKWGCRPFFSNEEIPRVDGVSIIRLIRHDLQDKSVASPTERTRRLGAFVIWVALSGLQTEDYRIRFDDSHIQEIRYLVKVLLSVRHYDNSLNPSELARQTLNLRYLVSSLVSDSDLRYELARTLDEDLHIANSYQLHPEDAYRDLRQLQQKFDEVISVDEGMGFEAPDSPDTFDLYNFSGSYDKQLRTSDHKQMLDSRIALLLEEYSARTLLPKRDGESNRSIWIKKARIAGRSGARLGGDLLSTIAAKRKDAKQKILGHRAGLALKRTFDFAVGMTLLILLAPLMLTVAALIAFTSAGPILYRSERIGKNGRVFECLKFRTMVVNADKLKQNLAAMNEREGILFKIRSDPRVTRLGRILRKFSLDELPQLFNVVRGEMSLVGPRPPLASEVARYELRHYQRLEVMPGLTGLWQVQARHDPSFAQYIALDTAYVENWSFWLDLKILWRSLGVAIRGTGS